MKGGALCQRVDTSEVCGRDSVFFQVRLWGDWNFGAAGIKSDSGAGCAFAGGGLLEESPGGDRP
jgi:hypothetical protein